jgi:hypothetical protein
MSQETQKKDAESRAAGRVFLGLWSLGIIFAYALAFWSLVSVNARHKAAASERHEARVNPDATEPGLTEAERTPPPGHEKDEPTKVHVGIYLDRIAEISVKQTTWTADFYIWFNWKGGDIKPGDNFQVVDGKIESKEKLKETAKGDAHYALYRVTARITKFFDVARFPADDHLLTLNIEDTASQSYELVYVPDVPGSSVSSRVKVPGYMIHKSGLVVRPHSYKTPRGDPHLPAEFRATYSQLIMGIWVTRPDLGFFLKMFLGLYVAVAISLLAFFIKPTDVDPRFGLGVGALFAAIANNYITSSYLPDTGIVTLTDMVNGTAIMTIFLTLLQSTISLYIFDIKENQGLSRRFDLVSFAILIVGYTAINVAIPLAAWAR